MCRLWQSVTSAVGLIKGIRAGVYKHIEEIPILTIGLENGKGGGGSTFQTSTSCQFSKLDVARLAGLFPLRALPRPRLLAVPCPQLLIVTRPAAPLT